MGRACASGDGANGSPAARRQTQGRGRLSHAADPDAAVSYLETVRAAFHDRPEKLKEFVGILRDWKSKRIGMDGAISRMKEVLDGEWQLIAGFNAFLPERLQIALPRKLVDCLEFIVKVKNRLEDDGDSYSSFLQILPMYSQTKSRGEILNMIFPLLRGHPDLLQDLLKLFHEDSSMGTCDRGSSRKLSLSLEDNVDIHGSDMGSKSACKHEIEKFDGGQMDLNSDYDDGSNKEEREQMCVKRNNMNVSDQDGDEDLVECDQSNTDNMKGWDELQQGIYDDLPFNSEGGIETCVVPKQYDLNSQKDMGFLNEGKEKENIVNDYNDRENDGFCDDLEGKDIKDSALPSSISITSSSNDMVGQLTRIDFSDCHRCTPSYCHLPKNHPVILPSMRTSLDQKVLNDVWVSATSGSEDFKSMHKNQYEKILFRCEDDRFEMDMLIESTAETAVRVEKLLEKLQMNQIKSEEALSYFNARNLRCMERMYGDHWLVVLDTLRNNTVNALAIVLARLKQKQEEWFKCRVDFNKVWKEIYAKIYHKSLDYRSFHFKQQDPNTLSAKALSEELKAISRKNQNENDAFRAVPFGHEWPNIPDKKFHFSDFSIHENLYQLIKYSCGELYDSVHEVDKVMSVWTTLLEPLLGTPSGSQKVDESILLAYTEDDNVPTADVTCHIVSDRGSGDFDVEYDSNMTTPTYKEYENESSLVTKGCLHQHSLHQALKETKKNVVKEQCSSSQNNSGENILRSGQSIGRTCKATDISAGRHCQVGVKVISEGLLAMDKKVHAIQDKVITQDTVEIDRTSAEGDGDGTVYAFASSIEMHPRGVNVKEVANEVAVNKAQARICDDSEERSIHNSDLFVKSVKPLTEYVPKLLLDKEEKPSHVMYGNESFFLFFRLHQVLYERILLAKTYCLLAGRESQISKNRSSRDLFWRFMNSLHSLLDGSHDNAKFEDDCYDIMGTKSYILFTLDKLIFRVIKQLYEIAMNENHNKFLQLYEYEKSRGAGRFNDTVYYANARLVCDGNLCRIRSQSSNSSVISVQLLDFQHGKPKTQVSVGSDIVAYLHDDFLSEIPKEKENCGIFLARNKRKNSLTDGYSTWGKREIQVINGLEYKVCSYPFKMMYILDTEDFLRRRKRKKIGCRQRLS